VIMMVLIGIVVLSVIGLFVAVPVGLGIVGGEKIALIRLSGAIAESGEAGLFSVSGITPSLVRGYLQRAADDPAVKAVVLRINSPGGTAAASQEIAAMIRDFDKPVVISMGDIAASGGYYISVYADAVVANPDTLTGSIGVITQLFYIQGLLEKLGIEMETIKSGEHKDMFFRPLSDKEKAILQDISDELYEQFIQAVAEGRELPPEKVRQLATGQLYSGIQAQKHGLVDKLGGLEDAIDLAAEIAQVETPLVEEYGPPSLWHWLLGVSTEIKQTLLSRLSDPQLLLLKMLQGWQAVPRY
jgi:protease-4